jgi:hypothetical protein
MTIKVEHVCDRCHRKDSIEVADAATAVKADATFLKKEAGVQKIKDLFEQLTTDGEMPDMVGSFGGVVVIHPYLCDPDEKAAKAGHELRSCVKQTAELGAKTAAFGPRAPKKKKGATVPAAATPAAK